MDLRTIILICLGILFLHSCQDDRYDGGQTKKNGTTAKLNLHTADYTQVGTRATNESVIVDVTILQFVNGKLTNTVTIDGQYWGAAVETDRLIAMPTSALDENGALIPSPDVNVMVLLANFKGGFDDYLGSITNEITFANFQKLTTSLAGADALAGLPNMPMTGYYYGGVTDGITNQINVTLTRALAKINFTLNATNFQYNGLPATVIVNTIELRNVPREMMFFNADRPSLPSGGQPGSWGGGQPVYYPATTGTADADNHIYDAANFVTLESKHNASATPLTNFVAYMPENLRGSYSNITTNDGKIPESVPAPNRLGWTYIYVNLDFANLEGLAGYAEYRIYLGGDAAGDMNILSGAQYNVTTNIYGANSADTRITVQATFDPRPDPNGNENVEILGMANSYIINNVDLKSDADKPLVLPLIQARKGWQYIQKSVSQPPVSDVTDYVSQFDAMIEAGNWEIVTLWKTENSTTNVTGEQSTITPLNNGNAAKYHAELKLNNGPLVSGNNYVIALRSTVDQTIWWTWHLWVTNYNPDATSPGDINGQVHTYMGQSFWPGGLNYNKVMMDRHLGATGSVTGNAAITPPADLDEALLWYGLLYEWGRKDPFTSNTKISTSVADATPIYDAGGIQISAATAWTATVDGGNATNLSQADGFPRHNNAVAAPPHRLVEATRMPYLYIYNTITPYDWTLRDDNLWGGSTELKTVFDPCPPGWKVPLANGAGNNPWAGFADNIASSVATVTGTGGIGIFEWQTTSNATGRYYDDGTTKAWYPASGRRNYGTGVFADVGTGGYSWAASINTTYGRHLYFTATDVYPQNYYYRAAGMPVRCVQE